MCLSLISITSERMELQSRAWIQKTRLSVLYPNMTSLNFDFTIICLSLRKNFEFVFSFLIEVVAPRAEVEKWKTNNFLFHKRQKSDYSRFQVRPIEGGAASRRLSLSTARPKPKRLVSMNSLATVEESGIEAKTNKNKNKRPPSAIVETKHQWRNKMATGLVTRGTDVKMLCTKRYRHCQ